MNVEEKVIGYPNSGNCIVSRSKGTVVDMLHPVTGLTVCYGKTLEDCRGEYPDAEIMRIDDWCKVKAEQQRTPFQWEPTTEEQYEEMLCVLPPKCYSSSGFLVGEPWDHDALTGEGRYQAFRIRGGEFEVANRPLTAREFRGEQ